MTPVLTLAVPLLLAATGDCYFVTNTRIAVIASCDFSPAAMAALPEETGEPAAGAARTPGPHHRGAATVRTSRAASRGPRPYVGARCEELERRLDAAERQRTTAERQRASALRQRDLALQALEAARRELAAARADAGQGRTAQLP